MGLLSALLVAGIYQDGWAHNHGKVDESFFTPWHFVLYATMALSGIVLFVVGVRNLVSRLPDGADLASRLRGAAGRAAIRDSIPAGYWSSVLGVVIFIVGGGLDLVWHTIFGIEVSLDALVSPTHLVLALGAALVCSGPIRSVAFRYGREAGGWAHVGPAIPAVAAVLALVGFFTQYAQPIGDDGIATVVAKSSDAGVVQGLYVMRADGTHQQRLFPSNADDAFGPSASPDGQRIVFRVASNGSAASDLYIGEASGRSKPRRITHSGRHDTQPAWSPDGRWIAYVSAPAGTSGDFELDVVRPDGSGERTVRQDVTTMSGPAWAPDARHIAVGSRNGVTDQIEIVDVATGAATWVRGADGGWPAWSNDGRRIYFSRSDVQGDPVSVDVVDAGSAPAESAAQTVVAGGASMAALSPDGSKLAFIRSDGGTDDVFVSHADGGDAVDASRLSGIDASRPTWAGGRIVFTAVGRARPSMSDYALALSLSGMLIQSIVVTGALLLLVRRWRIPLGAATVVLGLFAVALATQNDDYFAIPAAIVAGIAADVYIGVRGEAARTGTPFYALGFGLPFLLCAGYVAFVALARGLGWPPNMAIGSPFISGFAGLLVAFAFEAPLKEPAAATAPGP